MKYYARNLINDLKSLNHYISFSNNCICIFIVTFTLAFCSCSRDIDSKIADCYNDGDTIIQLSDLYEEDWDTVYFFTNAYSYDDILERIGPVFKGLYEDVGSRMLILNKNKVVYYKEWFVNYGQKKEGAIFMYKNDSKMMVIPREKAKFLIRRNDSDSYLVYPLF